MVILVCPQSSPLSISVAGRGNDIFLHWMSNCKGHDKKALKYSFPRGYHMHDKMRADICGSLFGTVQESTLLALQRYNETKEALVYSSLWGDGLEHKNVTPTSKMGSSKINFSKFAEDISIIDSNYPWTIFFILDIVSVFIANMT